MSRATRGLAGSLVALGENQNGRQRVWERRQLVRRQHFFHFGRVCEAGAGRPAPVTPDAGAR